MHFTESDLKERYLEKLLSSAKATAAEPKVIRWLSQMGRGATEAHVKDFLGSIATNKMIKFQERAMREYAVEWGNVSTAHKEFGLYKTIAEFMGPQEGLGVDFGCGVGHLIAEIQKLNKTPMLGIDLNSYTLQLAEQLLKSEDHDVTRMSDSHISFDPMKGFVLRPVPYSLDTPVDLSGINLLCEDFADMKNTTRVLYNQGRKADFATFTLSGGKETYDSGNFLRVLTPELDDIHSKKSPHYFMDTIINNLYRVCHYGAKVYFAIRFQALASDGGEIVEVGETSNDSNLVLLEEVEKFHRNHFHDRYNGKLELLKFGITEMLDETGFDGIGLNKGIIGSITSDASGGDLDEQVVKFDQYKVVLIEARVLGK
ncbi:class I SAM-dependent methyltransferase [Candidatus Woesearchaeota archaeon]|jgi:hypothetical protein|nr:class I SAM-dependent methyltransferase [Candidatus Woesearchaeota archaeon]MBT5272188.1 class I SAM-dependent methyltransferase [Candidatus Woesearchaeota archaeon]MBT6040515.1 class I SAM-dependent methyltransferase [Candidatus Woesearchaeota archaeon]MBT6336894.1 class I SAM-dependent methyltransferase [Candidatus Woesearchaeota archaeon]MBT7927764.1 class I SAM-dependent methyltransferase [Candidatus Woesearchaeota archaeon]